MELRQGEAWPSFEEYEGVFISFKLFPCRWPSVTVVSTRMDPGNPGGSRLGFAAVSPLLLIPL